MWICYFSLPCLCVCQFSHGWTVWRTDPKYGIGVDLDNISDEFEGQGTRQYFFIFFFKRTSCSSILVLSKGCFKLNRTMYRYTKCSFRLVSACHSRLWLRSGRMPGTGRVVAVLTLQRAALLGSPWPCGSGWAVLLLMMEDSLELESSANNPCYYTTGALTLGQ